MHAAAYPVMGRIRPVPFDRLPSVHRHSGGVRVRVGAILDLDRPCPHAIRPLSLPHTRASTMLTLTLSTLRLCGIRHMVLPPV